jgi:hypothetical protein
MLLEYLEQSTRDACIAAFSLRRLSTKYSGPVVRLRRSTDGAQDDFYRGGANILYNSAHQRVQAWLMGGTGYVVTWYDQSGRGNHATAPDQTSQPLLVLSPDWSTSAPSLRFDGSGNHLPFDGSALTGSGYTVHATTARASGRAMNFFLGGTTTTANANLRWDTRAIPYSFMPSIRPTVTR